MKALRTRPQRTERTYLRIAPQERRLIRLIAKDEGMTVTEFVVKSACAKAEEILEKKRQFQLPAAQWTTFMQALDRPVQEKPRLHRLLSEPGLLDRR